MNDHEGQRAVPSLSSDPPTCNRDGAYGVAGRLPNTYTVSTNLMQPYFRIGKAKKVRRAVYQEIAQSEQRGSIGEADHRLIRTSIGTFCTHIDSPAGQALMTIRPEHIQFCEQNSGSNKAACLVEQCQFMGTYYRHTIRAASK